MTYRHHPARIAHARDSVFRLAGETVVWRQYISASAANPAAGLGDAPIYREQTITALLGKVTQPEAQTPAGLLTSGDVYAVTRERLTARDELVWRGITFRVESDPAPARLAGTWTAILRRGEG